MEDNRAVSVIIASENSSADRGQTHSTGCSHYLYPMSRIKQAMHIGYSPRNRVELLRGGRPYFSRLEQMIQAATTSLHLQFYIFEPDDTGDRIIEQLRAAAKRNVSVHLHLDAYASARLDNKRVSSLRDAGVEVKWFEPLLRSTRFYVGRRLHHKIVVADGIKLLIGGLNICDRYNDLPNQPAWFDLAAYLEGETAYIAYHQCRLLWGEKELPPRIEWKAIDAFGDQILKAQQKDCRLRYNDWVRRKREITRSYLEQFQHAEKNILICCSYFLPGRLLRKKIAQARKRNVRIRLILTGVSDVPLAKAAERHLYRWMLERGIEIYEYQSNVLHAKAATIDDHWTTIGSYNLNEISALASLEANLDVKDQNFALVTRLLLEEVIRKDCKRIDPLAYSQYTEIQLLQMIR